MSTLLNDFVNIKLNKSALVFLQPIRAEAVMLAQQMAC